jgi:hypothetical protein
MNRAARAVDIAEQVVDSKIFCDTPGNMKPLLIICHVRKTEASHWS